VVFCLSIAPIGKTQGQPLTYNSSFLLLNRPDGDLTYQLNVTVSYSLVQYYSMQSHALYSGADFPKYVTPYTLKPIADRLWQIYDNNEDFTNGVLMLVHQIIYEETEPGKYPVETLMEGKGDCDLFCYIAASILEAGGIPTVLLYYKDQKHMEIGVDIGYKPTDTRSRIYQIDIQNTSYYVGECTGSKWRQGWRIGECPEEYQNITAQIISLDNIAWSSPEQVGAVLRELDPSVLTLEASPSFMLESGKVTLSGQITPKTTAENVTLHASINGGDWATIGTATTDKDGKFSYSWTPYAGTVELQASWIGNKELNGATSTTNSIIVVPFFLLAIILSGVLAVFMVTLAFVAVRRRKPPKSFLPSTNENPQPPTV
jgi:hypothetical protein